MNNVDLINIKNIDIEIELFLEAIFLKYGYDFRGYSRAHIKRRIVHRVKMEGFESVSQMQHRILEDREFFQKVLSDFSINVTEMFRDPSFFNKVRKEILPVLKSYPHIKIWHAGCSTGEEVYSMAILLKEENCYKRSQIYATDFNDKVISKAREGIYSIDSIREYTLNYQSAGGTQSFSDYYIANYNYAILEQSLKEKIIFAAHNLTSDGVFGEMNMIVCRNVLIYFNKELQNKVIKLFYESLCHGGFLCLGSKESLRFTDYNQYFEPVIEGEKIYRKKL
ncbi:MAG: protein-glutamate O-methyltransferase CheR [Clostridiaceae bacterium]